MKDLKEMILESIDASLKQRLIDLINSETLDDKTARKMLSAATTMNPEQKEIINAMLKQKGIEDTTKALQRILKDYDENDLLANIANGSISLSDSDEFVKGNNIYSLILSKYPGIDKECLKELAEFSPSKNSITRGMFEVLTQLFLSDIADNNDSKNSPTGHGDVNTKKYTIEFKTPTARVKSQKERTAKDIDLFIEYQLKKSNVKLKDLNLKLSKGGIFHSQESITEFFEAIKPLQWSDEELFDLAVKAILAMYEEKKTLTTKGFKLPFDSSRIQSQVISNGNINAKSLVRLMGCIQLKYYAEEEGYTHFCIFKGKTGKSAVNSGEYKCFTNSEVTDINFIFSNNSIAFSAGGKHNGASRENYCSITCV